VDEQLQAKSDYVVLTLRYSIMLIPHVNMSVLHNVINIMYIKDVL